jgi:hypothetical protein
MTFPLTPRNAAAFAQYADLVGITPKEFSTRALQEFMLTGFACTRATFLRLGDTSPLQGAAC